jgi:thioredoxin reductase (NADPH)
MKLDAMIIDPLIVAFGLPLVIMLCCYAIWQRRNTTVATARLQQAETSGLLEPATLHPAIDPSLCLGCATCVGACPEGEILGLVKRKAVLVSPSSCIGHGACREACPTGAISLVFGTESRGIEIPYVSTNFESTVPGMYIAGELGGMGLIKNAIFQGTQAVDAIAKKIGKARGTQIDLVIVGAGPAGISAALAARQKGLKFIVLEQDTIGGSIAHYPRGKIVMTQPAVLPIIGEFQFREASKETLMKFWKSAVDQIRDQIKINHRVENIERKGQQFKVSTNKGVIASRTVLLAMGRRGTPRKLGVRGEELSKVIYRLVDPDQYANRKVLIVGGGDSALEAAIAISKQPGASATLSYRSPAFSRAKVQNRQRVVAAQRTGNLRVLLESNVKQITGATVIIETGAGLTKIPNDDVLVCAGGVLPTPFLKKVGIDVEEKFGTA